MPYRSNKMKTIYTAVILLGLTVVSTSQIFLWKDQKQMWEIMNTQIQMLSRLLDQQSGTFEYEDELPEESGESI